MSSGRRLKGMAARCVSRECARGSRFHESGQRRHTMLGLEGNEDPYYRRPVNVVKSPGSRFHGRHRTANEDENSRRHTSPSVVPEPAMRRGDYDPVLRRTSYTEGYRDVSEPRHTTAGLNAYPLSSRSLGRTGAKEPSARYEEHKYGGHRSDYMNENYDPPRVARDSQRASVPREVDRENRSPGFARDSRALAPVSRREHTSMITGRGHELEETPIVDRRSGRDGLVRPAKKTSPQHPLLKLDFDHVAVLPNDAPRKLDPFVSEGYGTGGDHKQVRRTSGSARRDNDYGALPPISSRPPRNNGRDNLDDVALLRKVQDVVGLEEKPKQLSNSWPRLEDHEPDLARPTREARSMIAPKRSSWDYDERKEDADRIERRIKDVDRGQQEPPYESSSRSRSRHETARNRLPDPYDRPRYERDFEQLEGSARPPVGTLNEQSTMAYMRKYGLAEEASLVRSRDIPPPPRPTNGEILDHHHRSHAVFPEERAFEGRPSARDDPSAWSSTRPPIRDLERLDSRDVSPIVRSHTRATHCAVPSSTYASFVDDRDSYRNGAIPVLDSYTSETVRRIPRDQLERGIRTESHNEYADRRQAPQRREDFTRVLDLDRLKRLPKLPAVDDRGYGDENRAREPAFRHMAEEPRPLRGGSGARHLEDQFRRLQLGDRPGRHY